GLRPAPTSTVIAGAIGVRRGIGAERKAARLRWLRDRWALRLQAASPRVKILTPLNDTDSCAIALIHVDGIDTEKLQAYLWDKHRIMTTPIVHKEFNGLRITPSVYTTPAELDTFCGRMEEVLQKGLPAEATAARRAPRSSPGGYET